MRTWSDEVHPESWTLKCASPTLAVSGWAFSVPCFVGRSSRRLLQRRVPKLVSFVEPSMDDRGLRDEISDPLAIRRSGSRQLQRGTGLRTHHQRRCSNVASESDPAIDPFCKFRDYTRGKRSRSSSGEQRNRQLRSASSGVLC